MKNKALKISKKITSLILVLTLLFVSLLQVSCKKVETIEEIYIGTNEKDVNVSATTIFKGSDYSILGSGSDIFVVNSKDVEINSNYQVTGKAKIENGIFVVVEANLTKIETEIACEVNSEDMSSKLKEAYSSDLTKVKKIKMTGVLSWVGEVRGIYSKKYDTYLYTTDEMREFELFASSSSTVKIGDTVICEAYVIGITNDENGFGLNVLFSEVTPTDPEEDIENGGNIDKEETMDLHILELNDTHGYITRDETGKNGLANVAYLVNQIRNQSPKDDTVLIANGDMFQGTAISNLSHGLSVINAMNAMNFDCMTIGNHEFDWKLTEILKYFDNDKTNGEANFPLLNGNIYNVNDNSLVSITDGKLYSHMIVEKEGIKVGIIGLVGDVYSSINYAQSKEYYFENNLEKIVTTIGESLKYNGADVIVVAIHGGNSSSIEGYSVNNALANIKVDGEYLVDAIINGHTHSRQSGYISRIGGVRVPLVQGGCNAEALGEIVLTIDMATKKVTNATSKVIRTYTAGSSYDEKVQKVIDEEEKKIESQLSEVYAVAGESVDYASSLQPWVSRVLLDVTGADVSICNAGGLRSNGDIVKGGNITIENMYMINPFDNYILTLEVKGSDLKRFLENGSIFYKLKDGVTISNNGYYKVAVIDYVYYYDSFPRNEQTENTNIIMRDALIEDIKKNDVFYPITRP